MDGGEYFLEPLTQRELEILHLLADGLTNREIADKLVIAPATVKWYNKQIYSKLNAHSREQAVARARLAGVLPAHPDESGPSGFNHNLPAQITSFVGRQTEIRAVKQLLSTTRLLTLGGPPGTGKTRLALQVARQLFDRFRDGIFFVDLASIKDARFVLSTIAQELDLKEAQNQPLVDTLIYHFHDKQALLLLDNFEQVIEAAPLTSELLSACPDLKILVTSREPLHVYGEQEYTVPPLAVPDDFYPASLQVMSQYESVDLFCQRARAIKPDFTLTENNVPHVAKICVRLDGLPLAIELAAARSKLFTPESISARLECRLGTLTGGARDLPRRQQTLRGAIDWSYDLLDIDEQRLINRLSVFQGGRTVEAIETVCNSNLSLPIVAGIESLLNKSLLYSETGKSGETRFFMLEIIHEYAREQLDQSGETDDMVRRHAEYFLALAEQAETEIHGGNLEYWYACIADELDNIRTALDRSFDEGQFELGARLVGALHEFWYTKGMLSESSIWIEKALEKEGQISPAVLARTLNSASRLAYAAGNHEAGELHARQALSLAQEIDDKEICAWASLFLSSHLISSADRIKEAKTYAEECLHLFQELENKSGVAYGLNMLGELARLEGDYPRAGQLYGECLAMSKESDDKLRAAISLGNLSYVAYHQGDFTRAIDYCKESIALMLSLQIDFYNAIVLAMIAGPIAAIGEPQRAARLLAVSQAQMDMLGASIQPADKIEADRYTDTIREQLGETEFKQAWAEGCEMTMEQALAEAVAETRPPRHN